MSEIVSRDKLNELLATRKRPSSEPLPAEWFDGKIREFKRDTDFTTKVESFRGKLHVQARNHGISMRVFVIDENTVMAYAVRPNGKAK